MKRTVLTSAILIVLSEVYISYKSSNNVCKTFDDYYTNRDNNKNCYFNPDYELPVPDIIQRHGYPVETYEVTTKDGYILTLFRIPSRNNSDTTKPGRPVFLQHGLASNAGCFINRGQKSLGFILSNEGYDVWLGNFRGTIYSRNHTHLDDSDSEFWEFSFHEHGIYDLTAQMDFVANKTNQKMIYIGYSQGTMSMYVYSTVHSEQAAKQIDLFINLAPSAFLGNSKSSLKHLLRYWLTAEPLIRFITGGQLYSRVKPQTLIKYLCYPYPFQLKLCQIPDMLLFGFSYGQNDPETLPISFLHNVDWISVKGFSHIVQLSHTEHFQNFDYGIETNKMVYGTPEPERYNISKMLIPTYFIRADNDMVISKENVERLYKELPDRVKSYDIYVIPDEEFSHLDFVAGKDAASLLYNHIVEFLGNL